MVFGRGSLVACASGRLILMRVERRVIDDDVVGCETNVARDKYLHGTSNLVAFHGLAVNLLRLGEHPNITLGNWTHRASCHQRTTSFDEDAVRSGTRKR